MRLANLFIYQVLGNHKIKGELTMQISNLNVQPQNHTQRQTVNRSQPAFGRAEFIIGMAKIKGQKIKASKATNILDDIKKAFFQNPELNKAIEDSSPKNKVEMVVSPQKDPLGIKEYNVVVENNIYGKTTIMTGHRLENGTTFNQGFVDEFKEELGKNEKDLQALKEKYENMFALGPRRY